MAQWTWDATHFDFSNANNHTFDGFHTHAASQPSTPSDKVHAISAHSKSHTIAADGNAHTILTDSKVHTV